MDQVKQPADLLPRCPYCGQDPFIIAARVEEIPGVGKVLLSYCGHDNCRKLFTSTMMPQASRIELPGGIPV